MKKIISYLSVLLVIVSCETSRKASTSSQNSAYRRDANAIHPQYVVFHVSDSISELHFKISSKELLYMRPDGINFYSNVLISYSLLPAYDSKEVVDSASVRLVDLNNENADKYLLGKIKIKARSAHTYFLRVTVADQNRNSDVTTVIYIEKNNDLNRQNFMVKSKTTDAPLFRNYVKTNEELTINYKAKIAVSLFVRYYKRDFPVAAPPFSITDPKPFQYKQDSSFTLQLSADGSVNFKALKKGFYHFQIDTSKREGLTLFYFSDAFPEVKKAEDMVSPLRFITTQSEFDEVRLSINKKTAIEKFWLTCTGNQDRAKEIIRKFYNRVQDANQYFTSYIEGWKTDRGMVYLIYGSPNVINKTSNSETWIYGEENNINSLSYTFSKVNNPFTNNDFTLERSEVYKQPWFTAVDIWRQGRTYLQN
jgi:GWxTD domain-containing protein